MTKKRVAILVAGVLTAAGAVLYKCQDDSPLLPSPGTDTSAPGKVDAGT